MSQTKLQVYTEEANPILESYFQTLLGQENTFSFGEATETTIDQLKTDATTFFSIVGNPKNAISYIVHLGPEWVPVITAAMVGHEMTADEEGVVELTEQIVSQSYEKLKSEHARCSALPNIEASPFAPGTWEPENTLPTNYWRLPFEMKVGADSLTGNLYVPGEVIENMDDLPAMSNEETTPDDLVQENTVDVSTPKFPDFGREHLKQDGPGNFDLLAEVELNVTVELGRRKIPLSEVLKLTTGSVIELEKLVGEPLEIFANGRLIAEGEAVVIEEQFGVRITNLASNKLRAKAFA